MSSNYDVVVVGAGCAGMTAAIGLARSGFAVAVLEAAAYPGAENWSGCVYFCENLAHPDILGPDGVESLAWERRLIERGSFVTNGHGLFGISYRDPRAFRHCYTVLRPIFDHHLAQIAVRHGIALLNETTAESLIREGNRVIGIATNRGPLYADLVFLAEGDASYLVTREGYERYTDPREAPKFLQGIKQVIELPPGAIEEAFGVGPEDGVAYEMLVRNGSLRGRDVRLNMGGFLYTNRQSVSLGLVLPADNLKEHFAGDPNLLMEWFENLPALRPWLRNGRRGPFGAKIIRGGGAKDIPRLIDNGLAIGGAASAIGIDFPYPNFTGPATAMGRLLVEAARRIREEKTGFTHEALRRHYLEQLQRTHHWQDVEFLRRWPGYVKRTSVFFGRNLDLALGAAYVWTRPGKWFLTRWFNWLRLNWHVAGPGHWQEVRTDLRHLIRALRLREVLGRPGLGRLLLDGTVNAFRDLIGSPRPNLPQAGTVRLHYGVAGGAEATALPPRLFRRWFQRFTPILASAARRLYTNDAEPLADKLHGAARLLVRQVNMLDLLGIGLLGLSAAVSGAVLLAADRLRAWLRKNRGPRPVQGLYSRFAEASRQAADLTPVVAAAAQHWEGRLGQLAYQTVRSSHIHVLWPQSLPEKRQVVNEGLWHVCPAHVYEARVSPLGQLQIVVNFENCIKCETCWRTSNLADWGRDGAHRFIYPVHSPVADRLVTAAREAGSARSALPRAVDHWEPAVRDLEKQLRADRPRLSNGQNAAEVAELDGLLDRLERKLAAFDETLAEEPRTVNRARADYLEMLARYAQQLANRIVEVLRASGLAHHQHPSVVGVHEKLVQLATALLAKTEERAQRTWNQRYSWAAADGRQIRQHHITGLRRFLRILAKHVTGPAVATEPVKAWLQAEIDAESVANDRNKWVARLDAVFPGSFWRDLDRGEPLTSEQDAVLRDLVAQVPVVDPADLARTLHPPSRKALLAELARRDPSLAYRAAAHLWARDLARLSSGTSALARAWQRWARGDEWACFMVVDGVQNSGGSWQGEALFVPARGVKNVLLLVGNNLAVVPVGQAGLRIEPLATLGLRGAGMAHVQLENLTLPPERAPVDHDRVLRAWIVLSAADLTSIARGMAEQLCARTIQHAVSRVQFPGLFQDDQARDPIGKFGAVKKMVAEMAARRYLIETLDHVLTPTDFSSPSVGQSGLVKLVVAEALGTSPGSLSYNAGQVFGGTGYSEDDILAKFYRDASAWRFLGPANVEIGRRHGNELLRGWRSDGQRLASVRGEAELVDQLAQRKALQAELDEIRVVRSRLRGMVKEWLAAADTTRNAPNQAGDNRIAFSARALGEVAEGLARQDAYLLASKALLLRTHARLEQGLPSAIETALLRVWLDGASVSLEEFENALRHQFSTADNMDDRPVVEPSAGPPVLTYTDFLKAPATYDSAAFIGNPVDLLQPRLVPEMIDTDPVLSERNHGLRDQIAGYFGRPRADGLPYERHIERQHRPDAEDLDFCRQHGYFRVMIPPELGGDGLRKIDYYLLITNAQRLSDIAISLTIQVNTSIGTTPVVLARDKDLPKARKDLGPFVGDLAVQEEVRKGLENILNLLACPEPKAIEQAAKALHQRLETSVFAKPALKALTHRFVEAWTDAGRAGKDFELESMKSRIGEALVAWKDACNRAEEQYGELARRLEACDLFLRWVAAGQISAFALTEPSAGSDTARVATRAVLRSVPVDPGTDGSFHFVPSGGKETRTLLDARRVEFRNEDVSGFREYRAYYRWSPDAEPARIQFDEYDYESDDTEKKRYYEADGRRVYFTDIAQLRQRDGRPWYDYWELTGAKMWITNGRMCGIMCLYAKTEEGITGFIVDRHAEGLVVGKDEEKLGQCGSPTNELSLQAVRVPRENVIGLEGRGQVNALETLNVGRAGLPITAVAQMPGLIEASRAFAQAAYGEIPDWVAWRLARMEEERFTAEALAFEVIGRFEHPQTKSVRMESAISKMLVSEALHRVIELAEDIHGLAGQTQLHLVEKRKRDARVLNIYEGTNEIQRFFVLRDLVAAAGGKSKEERKAQHTGRESLQLESLRGMLNQRLAAATAVFGTELGQDPSLQANCFLLSEAAGWFKAADSTLGRLAWLSRQEAADDGQSGEDSLAAGQLSFSMELGRRAFERACAQVRERLRRFDEELTHLRRGFYAPEIRAAGLLFDQAAKAPVPVRPSSRIVRPLSVLVVLEPSSAAVPHPYLRDGRLMESHWTLSEADRAALETALRLRDEAETTVHIHVVAAGPRAAAPVLREALSLGADRARLVVTDGSPVTADRAAAALAALSRSGPKFDLILGGAGASGTEEGVVATLTAESLDVPFAGGAAFLAVRSGDSEAEVLLAGADGRQRIRMLPAAVNMEPSHSLRTFTMEGYLAGLSKPVEMERWPRRIEVRTTTYVEGLETAGVAEVPPGALTAPEAAGQVLSQLGLRTDSSAMVGPFEGVIEDVPGPNLLEGAVTAVLAADGTGRLLPSAAVVLRAARVMADLEGMEPVVLLLVPDEESAQRRALAQLRVLFRGDLLLLAAGKSEGTAEVVYGRVLREIFAGGTPLPRVAVGEPWTEVTFAALGSRSLPAGTVAQRIRRLAFEGDLVLLETSRERGKLIARQTVPSGTDAPAWITLAAEAEIVDNRSAVMGRLKPFKAEAFQDGRVQRWSPQLERFYGRQDIQRLLGELQAETGLANLADAEVIIDVGFGVLNRDGYEAVIEPLEKALRGLGVRSLVIGGSRKVTEELHLLPVDRQIGQSGVSVNPRLLLAIGVSGAPQHLNYIGSQAAIIAFNRDPEAPIMTLNRRLPRPRVFPVIGDLFETVPAFVAALRAEERTPANV